LGVSREVIRTPRQLWPVRLTAPRDDRADCLHVTTLSWPATPAAVSLTQEPDPETSTVPALPGEVRAALAGVVERLHAEYECCLPLSRVLGVVVACLDDIQATPASALPELVERLARFRLAQTGHRP
jgi:hypothetical protein